MVRIAVLGIGLGGVIVALVAFRALDRPRDRPSPPAVDMAPAPPGTTSAPAEALDPLVRALPEPPARREAPVNPPPVVVPSASLPRAGDGERPGEADVLARLHDLAASDPEQSLKLARDALERFPEGSNASEFEWNVVKALFNLGRLEDAKDEARVMVRNYPNSDFTGDVERHLLNPPPNP